MRSFSIPLLSLSLFLPVSPPFPSLTPSPSLSLFLSRSPSLPLSLSFSPPLSLAFSCSSLSSPLVSLPHLNIRLTHSIYRRPRKMITNNGGKTRISSLSGTRIAYRPFRVQRHYVRYFISLFAFGSNALLSYLLFPFLVVSVELSAL